jgi:hypothetical protein
MSSASRTPRPRVTRYAAVYKPRDANCKKALRIGCARRRAATLRFASCLGHHRRFEMPPPKTAEEWAAMTDDEVRTIGQDYGAHVSVVAQAEMMRRLIVALEQREGCVREGVAPARGSDRRPRLADRLACVRRDPLEALSEQASRRPIDAQTPRNVLVEGSGVFLIGNRETPARVPLPTTCRRTPPVG